MNEPWGHYAKWNRLVTKRQIVCDSTYMRYLDVVKFIDTESKMVAANGYEEWEIQSCLTSMEFPFCKMERILIVIEQYEVLNTTEMCT